MIFPNNLILIGLLTKITTIAFAQSTAFQADEAAINILVKSNYADSDSYRDEFESDLIQAMLNLEENELKGFKQSLLIRSKTFSSSLFIRNYGFSNAKALWQASMTTLAGRNWKAHGYQKIKNILSSHDFNDQQIASFIQIDREFEEASSKSNLNNRYSYLAEDVIFPELRSAEIKIMRNEAFEINERDGILQTVLDHAAAGGENPNQSIQGFLNQIRNITMLTPPDHWTLEERKLKSFKLSKKGKFVRKRVNEAVRQFAMLKYPNLGKAERWIAEFNRAIESAKQNDEFEAHILRGLQVVWKLHNRKTHQFRAEDRQQSIILAPKHRILNAVSGALFARHRKIYARTTIPNLLNRVERLRKENKISQKLFDEYNLVLSWVD